MHCEQTKSNLQFEIEVLRYALEECRAQAMLPTFRSGMPDTIEQASVKACKEINKVASKALKLNVAVC